MSSMKPMFTEPGRFTSPGKHASAFTALPAGVAALTEVAQGLIVHEHMTRAYGFDLRLAFEDDPSNHAMYVAAGVPCVYIHSGYYE